MRIVVQPDQVYLYHTTRLPPGHGIHVYRQDGPGQPFRQLTTGPVRRVRSGGELQSQLGERFREVMDFFEAQTANELWLLLQSRLMETMVAVSLYPELAASMGMLYVDESAPIGEQVSYRIEFVDLPGQPYGETITRQKRLTPQLPDPPTGLRAENQGAVVTLHWTYPRVTFDTDDKVIRFFVYRICPDTGIPELIDDEIVLRNNAFDEHFVFFRSAWVNTTESYFVTAADITGQQSDASEIVHHEVLDLPRPAFVHDLRAIVTRDNITGLSWAATSDPVAIGYHVYRTHDLSHSFTRLTDEVLPIATTLFYDREVAEGTTYFYQVTAVNAAGGESERGDLEMVHIRDITPPPPPENLTASFDMAANTVSLRWETREIVPDLKTFVVLRRREEGRNIGGYSRVNFRDHTALSLLDEGETGTGFHEGGTYRYVVYAVDHAENYSDTASVMIDIPLYTPPMAPSELLAINNDGLRVSLNWQASHAQYLQGYVLYRADEGGDDLGEIARLDPATRRYRDEEVEPGRTYRYVVTAVDKAGNESDFSATDTIFFRDRTPPRRVQNVQAAEIDEGVVIQWERVPENHLAGYRVYRSTIATGIFEPVHDGLLSETRYVDTEGHAGLWYRVRAVNTSGNESRPDPAIRPIRTND